MKTVELLDGLTTSLNTPSCQSSPTGAALLDQEIDMGFDRRYREPASELARASALRPAGRLCGW